jgi:hypothetical protein
MAATSVSSRTATDILLLDALKSDTVDLAKPVRAIRATVAGDIKLTTKAGNAIVCAFAAGETRNIYATRIWSTSTTATGMEGHI